MFKFLKKKSVNKHFVQTDKLDLTPLCNDLGDDDALSNISLLLNGYTPDKNYDVVYVIGYDVFIYHIVSESILKKTVNIDVECYIVKDSNYITYCDKKIVKSNNLLSNVYDDVHSDDFCNVIDIINTYRVSKGLKRIVFNKHMKSIQMSLK